MGAFEPSSASTIVCPVLANAWLGRVHQRYKEERTLAMAQKKGYIFRGREVIQTERGEQVKLLFAARAETGGEHPL